MLSVKVARSDSYNQSSGSVQFVYNLQSRNRNLVKGSISKCITALALLNVLCLVTSMTDIYMLTI
jgi:hypothetical protein